MKKPRAPKLVTVSIFTTITIIFWVFFSLYRILTESPPSHVDPKLLEPINPELDRNTLNKLEGRVFFGESDVTTPVLVPISPFPKFPESTLVSPTEVPSEEPETSTPSGQSL